MTTTSIPTATVDGRARDRALIPGEPLGGVMEVREGLSRRTVMFPMVHWKVSDGSLQCACSSARPQYGSGGVPLDGSGNLLHPVPENLLLPAERSRQDDLDDLG